MTRIARDGTVFADPVGPGEEEEETEDEDEDVRSFVVDFESPDSDDLVSIDVSAPDARDAIDVAEEFLEEMIQSKDQTFWNESLGRLPKPGEVFTPVGVEQNDEE